MPTGARGTVTPIIGPNGGPGVFVELDELVRKEKVQQRWIQRRDMSSEYLVDRKSDNNYSL